jgi:hypothetical protein
MKVTRAKHMTRNIKNLQSKYFNTADLYLNHIEEETFLKCMHQKSLISKATANHQTCTTLAHRDYENKLKNF